VTKSSKLILLNLLVFGLAVPLASTTQAQTYQSGTDIPTQFKSARPGSFNAGTSPSNTGNPPTGSTLGGPDVDRMYFCSPFSTPRGAQALAPIYTVPVTQSSSGFSAYSWVTNSDGTPYVVRENLTELTPALLNVVRENLTELTPVLLKQLLEQIARSESTNVPYINVSVYASQSVQGSVRYSIPSFKITSTSTTRRFQGNGIPSVQTGIFPVRPNDPAYPYYSAATVQSPWNTADKIPITPYQLDITVPLNPTYNNTPECINLQRTLIVGVSLNGDTFHHNIATSIGVDAVDPLTALPLDLNFGHPYTTQYHRHAYIWKIQAQTASNQHSSLIGYALDGFGMYGPKGENGVLLTNQQLDVCHGHIHNITWNGQVRNMYHYHANNEFPYAPACFRGTPTYPSEKYAHDPATHRVAPRGLPAPLFKLGL